MNKKGQIGVFGYGMMLGITIIVLALAFAPVIQLFVNNAMNTSTASMIGLDCSNSSISNFDKGTCTILDFSSFYFFSSILLLGGAIIVAKIVF
jgi:hypothetical protein